MQQDRKQITKTNKNQIKLKQKKSKFKQKQPVKAMKQKKTNVCQKNELMLTHKNRLSLVVEGLTERFK